MVSTLILQFLTSVGDNSLLFAAIALVRKDAFPTWSGPLLQEFFVASYILLAPFVGVLADKWPKSRVMLSANVVKFTGTLGMSLGVNPFLCYALVGSGAAAYSPAKYGILGDLTAPVHLVKANGLIETASVAGIVVGAVTGGSLTDWSIEGALVAIAGFYAAAATMALFIPRVARSAAIPPFSIIGSVEIFARQTRALLKDPDARLALTGTSIFWGAGAALRFLVIAWVPVTLGVRNNRLPAFLTAMVAAGIVLGAALAARFVKLAVVRRALPAGILIGVGVGLLAFVRNVPLAFLLMTFVGICSGFFVVPLDALLQKEGERNAAVGSAIATQNLFENFSMLALVACYTAVAYLRVPVDAIALCFGVFMSISIAGLTLMRGKPSAT
jgi:LPLT family lysophospholipid transporter-like MFS transporter